MNRAFSASGFCPTNPGALTQAAGECCALGAKKHTIQVLRSAHFLQGSAATNQQPHKKINNYCGRDRKEERTNGGGPQGRPDDARKYMPVHVVAQSKLPKMNALCYRPIEAPASQMIFGNVNCRHRPNEYVVQGHRNRSCDFIAAANPGHCDRQ